MNDIADTNFLITHYLGYGLSWLFIAIFVSALAIFVKRMIWPMRDLHTEASLHRDMVRLAKRAEDRRRAQ